MNDLNPNSETIYPEALVEPGFEEVRRRAPWPESAGEHDKFGPESVRFQALRIAYLVSKLQIHVSIVVTDSFQGNGFGFHR